LDLRSVARFVLSRYARTKQSTQLRPLSGALGFVVMKSGSYRNVFLIGRAALKIPRLSNFSKGLRCNRWEGELYNEWRLKFGWRHLCPVIMAGPFGIFLIMTRADQPVTERRIKKAIENEYDYHPEPNIEYKPENWGVIDGNLVCLDYGHSTTESMMNDRHYFSNFYS